MGELRIGTVTPGPGDYDLTSWRHLACQKPPKLVSQPSDLAGFSALSADDQKKVEDWLAAGVGGGGGGATASGNKRTREELEEVAGLEPKKMKGKELDAALKKAGLSVKGKKEKQQAMAEVVKRAAVRQPVLAACRHFQSES